MIGKGDRHRAVFLADLLVLLLLFSHLAHADCARPTHAEDTIIDNSAENVAQACAGSTWVALGSLDWKALFGGASGCAGPAGCENVGDVCTDGTVFAGCGGADFHPFLVTRCDADQRWGSSCTGTRVTPYWSDSKSTDSYRRSGVTDPSDGLANTVALTSGIVDDTGDARTTAGLQTHNAAQYCADLNIHGHTDWYLPARGELYIMWLNKATIGNFIDLAPIYFWSSSEYDDDEAWIQGFGEGAQSHYLKHNSGYNVRCARRD